MNTRKHFTALKVRNELNLTSKTIFSHINSVDVSHTMIHLNKIILNINITNGNKVIKSKKKYIDRIKFKKIITTFANKG